MVRSWSCVAVVLLLITHAPAADRSPSDEAIAKAVKLLESERDKIDDGLERARLDKIIRDLESAIDDPEHDVKPSALTFEVTSAALKKKFAGKATFNPKTGELSLAYDFPGKAQLSDFEVGDKKVLITKKTLFIEAGDELKHIAKWRSFTVNSVLSFKEMAGAGVASSNGAQFRLAGAGSATILLAMPLGETVRKIAPPSVRNGSVPAIFSVTPKKATARWGDEILAVPAPKLAVQQEVPPHQVVLHAGRVGCGFGNLTITGVPDPEWLENFLRD